MIHLKKIKANLELFPRETKTGTLFSMGFVVFLLLVAYMMILFFLKLNIIQTLIGLGMIGVPGGFVLYYALKKHTIQV